MRRVKCHGTVTMQNGKKQDTQDVQITLSER